jgi:hypothetical protein
LFDVLGSGFTLLRLNAEAIADCVVAAAAVRGVPLRVVDLPEPGLGADDATGVTMVLVRPDQHIAWRTRSLQVGRAAAEQIVDTMVGRVTGGARA